MSSELRETLNFREQFKSIFSARIRFSLELAEQKATGLCQLINYQQSDCSEDGVPTGVFSVRTELANIWDNRGQTRANKESVSIMATMAISGQGKTELCQQLAKSHDLHKNLPDIDYLRSFHVTFNQSTSYSSKEASSMSIEQSLCWRLAFSAIGSNAGLSKSELSQYSLRDLIDDLRDCLREVEKAANPGLLISIDEFLKISPIESQKLLLDAVSSEQLERLENEVPVFFLITCLRYSESMYQFRTESGRPVKLVNLPTLSDFGLKGITDLIYRDILEAATADDISYKAEVDGRGDLFRLIGTAVWLTGRHFRSLEIVLRRIFSMCVTDAARKESIKLGNSVLAKNSYFETSGDAGLALHTIAAREYWIESVFECVIEARGLENEDKVFRLAVDIFLALLCDKRYCIEEKGDVYILESCCILFVKKRMRAVGTIVPRISLPFLYKYGVSHTKYSDSGPLESHIPRLFVDIFNGLNGLDKDFACAFEKVIPAIELVRMLALQANFNRSQATLSLEDVLPGCIIKPWDRETLQVSPWVLNSSILPSAQISPTSKDRKQSNAHLLLMALDMATDIDNKTVFVTQSESAVFESIEHIGCQFSAMRPEDEEAEKLQRVITLNSMKFQRADSKESPSLVSSKVHEKFQPLLRPNSLRNYYVVLYCCVPKARINVDELHPGTVIVPLETVQCLLEPFGASSLLYLAEKKGLIEKA